MWFVCALRQQSAEWAAECVYGLRVILLAIVLGVLFFCRCFWLLVVLRSVVAVVGASVRKGSS